MEATEGLPDLRPLITRQMCWDMVPHDMVLDVLRYLDLIPGTDEGLEIEHRDCHLRLVNLAPYAEVISGCSDIAAKVYSALYFHNVEDDDFDEDAKAAKEMFDEQNYEIIASALVAVIAQLTEAGVIALRRPVS